QTSRPAPFTLSLHHALPIWCGDPSTFGRSSFGDAKDHLHHSLTVLFTEARAGRGAEAVLEELLGYLAAHHGMLGEHGPEVHGLPDRKSTRLNSSHVKTSYAV